MDALQTKPCTNCKRDIPADNFTIHSVHCARNISVCPVCKEPVPHSDLADHHDKFHKLLPCAACGERVRGTDLEDHVRDSCALTARPCRHCELELPRAHLPAHEAYCGARTERCAQCRQYVMVKYRQLHLDSNHGFLKLNDEPGPKMNNEDTIQAAARTNVASTSAGDEPQASRASGNNPPTVNEFVQAMTPTNNGDYTQLLQQTKMTNMNYGKPRNFGNVQRTNVNLTALPPVGNVENVVPLNGAYQRPPKRNNDKYQVNTSTVGANKVDKTMASPSRGAIKKRPAPAPPASPRRPHGHRQEPYHRRHLQDNVWRQPSTRLQSGDHIAGAADSSDDRDASPTPEPPREDFRNFKPMTPEEFMKRFQELQLQNDTDGDTRHRDKYETTALGNNASKSGNVTSSNVGASASNDRFNDIKKELRKLRRGLNEVTAPYNAAASAAPASPTTDPVLELEVRLPCEFCGALVQAADLVEHQMGCRPELAQRGPAPALLVPLAPPPCPCPPSPPSPPLLIPCEFCCQPLPLCLVQEHQLQCQQLLDS